MPIPEVIPIAEEGDDHITALGRYADGLYVGFICADRDHWVASLHTFTADGVHRGSQICPVPMGERGPKTAESYEAAASKLVAMLATLDSRTAGDIAVRPFAASSEGFTIALIVNEEYEFADLLPVGIRFSEPWDGGYCT
ncbi:hypothetical protein [Micromonospora aurantiaca (nom. illeg.)]|uniref:hypothetical protein n=1 Tax=Micromonospora aurantiaca (nom. illeg.) TaxID=47850 RepID=UPI0036556EE0